jgi:hypothetical protein
MRIIEDNNFPFETLNGYPGPVTLVGLSSITLKRNIPFLIIKNCNNINVKSFGTEISIIESTFTNTEFNYFQITLEKINSVPKGLNFDSYLDLIDCNLDVITLYTKPVRITNSKIQKLNADNVKFVLNKNLELLNYNRIEIIKCEKVFARKKIFVDRLVVNYSKKLFFRNVYGNEVHIFHNDFIDLDCFRNFKIIRIRTYCQNIIRSKKYRKEKSKLFIIKKEYDLEWYFPKNKFICKLNENLITAKAVKTESVCGASCVLI